MKNSLKHLTDSIRKVSNFNTIKGSQVLSEKFNEITTDLLENMLLRLRSAYFDPQFLAQNISTLLGGNYPKNNVTSLDVGCNQGTKRELLMTTLSHMGCSNINYIGTDIAEKCIEIAQKGNPYPNVHYIHEDFLNLPEDTTYDYIFLSAVWHHLHNQQEALQKIESLLKPGGIGLIFNVFDPENEIPQIAWIFTQRIIRYIENRKGLGYGPVLLSEITKLTTEHCPTLQYKGEFQTQYPILNARMVVIKKDEHPEKL